MWKFHKTKFPKRKKDSCTLTVFFNILSYFSYYFILYLILSCSLSFYSLFSRSAQVHLKTYGCKLKSTQPLMGAISRLPWPYMRTSAESWPNVKIAINIKNKKVLQETHDKSKHPCINCVFFILNFL